MFKGHSNGNHNGHSNGASRGRVANGAAKLGDAALLVFDCAGGPLRPDTKLAKLYCSQRELRAFRGRLTKKATEAGLHGNLARLRITPETTFTDIILRIAH